MDNVTHIADIIGTLSAVQIMELIKLIAPEAQWEEFEKDKQTSFGYHQHAPGLVAREHCPGDAGAPFFGTGQRDERDVGHRVGDHVARLARCCLARLDRQRSAQAAGEEPMPIIAYADFSDYIKIIERKDNWNQVFALAFKRKTDIQESFNRLMPARIVTMHARIITFDDHLLLLAEVRRILKAIGII